MNVSFILILLLFGSIATFFAGNKYAKIVALSFSLVSVAASFYILNQFNHGVPTDFMLQWIYNPIVFVYFKVDGLSLLMLLLTTILTSIIIFSSFGNQYDKSNNFYALVLFMSFAMVGTFLSADGFMYYIFWELALLPIYFISLIWGNGDADERKKAVIKFFVFTLAGSLFMLIAFMYLYRKAGTLLINDMYAVLLTQNE